MTAVEMTSRMVCPTCRGAGHVARSPRPRGRLQRRLAQVGSEFETVAVGASRWFARQAERSYGHEFEFRATWRDETWIVEARRR